MWANAQPISKESLVDGGYLIWVRYQTDDDDPRTFNGKVTLSIGQGIDEFNAAVIQQIDDLNTEDEAYALKIAGRDTLQAAVDSIDISSPLDIKAVRESVLAKSSGTVDTTVNPVTVAPVVPLPPVTP